MWPLGEPTEQGPVDLRPGTRPHAGRAEEDLLVIAQDGERVELAQPADDRVGEAILEDAVAATEQRIDRAHDLEGPIEAIDVAVEVGDNTELQQRPLVRLACRIDCSPAAAGAQTLSSLGRRAPSSEHIPFVWTAERDVARCGACRRQRTPGDGPDVRARRKHLVQDRESPGRSVARPAGGWPGGDARSGVVSDRRPRLPRARPRPAAALAHIPKWRNHFLP